MHFGCQAPITLELRPKRWLKKGLRRTKEKPAMTLAVIGCSHVPANEYQEPDEKWNAPTFPRRGASLHETVAGLYASREGDSRAVILKTEVLRTGVTP